GLRVIEAPHAREVVELSERLALFRAELERDRERRKKRPDLHLLVVRVGERSLAEPGPPSERDVALRQRDVCEHVPGEARPVDRRQHIVAIQDDPPRRAHHRTLRVNARMNDERTRSASTARTTCAFSGSRASAAPNAARTSKPGVVSALSISSLTARPPSTMVSRSLGERPMIDWPRVSGSGPVTTRTSAGRTSVAALASSATAAATTSG